MRSGLGRAFAALPTNEHLTLVIGGWPVIEFEANRKDIEGNFPKTVELASPLGERVHAARRVMTGAAAAAKKPG